MEYKNEKLQVTIESAEVFEIVERPNHLELRAKEVTKFRVFAKSTVRAFGSSTVRAFGSSSVEAFGSSTVVAFGFCCVFVKSGNSKVKPENHFGAIIQQVFKTTKKTIVFKKLKDGLVAELALSKGQIFQSENHGKCRTDRAEVLSITDVDGKKYLEGHSTHDHTFVYTVGAVVSAPYDKEVKECSTGIHFFLTREEAERY